jgi:hypothetical protein
MRTLGLLGCPQNTLLSPISSQIIPGNLPYYFLKPHYNIMNLSTPRFPSTSTIQVSLRRISNDPFPKRKMNFITDIKCFLCDMKLLRLYSVYK